MPSSIRKPIIVSERRIKTYDGPDGQKLLGDVRLMQFLRRLHSEQPPVFWIVRLFQEMEQGKSIESLIAPKSGYRLSVEKTQDENRFGIWFGFYHPGFRIGGISRKYDAAFDEAGNIKELKVTLYAIS